MKDFTAITSTGKCWSKNDKIYLKPNWRWRAKIIMYKPDGLGGRWTQIIKHKHLIDGLVPFYLVPLIRLHEAGNSIIRCMIVDGREIEDFIVQIGDILDSRKQFGRGALTQMLFDQNYKHLNLKEIKK